MPSIKCKCGRWTNYGLLCALCQTNMIDSSPTPPEEEEFEEAGYSIIDDLFDEEENEKEKY